MLSQVSVEVKGVGRGGLNVPEIQKGDQTLSVKNGYLVQLFQGSMLMSTPSLAGVAALPSPRAK